MPRVLYVRRPGATTPVRSELREADFSVDTAATTADARSAVVENAYDCVITRYEVPRPDGLEFGGGLTVVETIREVDPDIPCILFTRIVNRDVVEEVIARGVDDYVQHGREGSIDRLLTRVRAETENYRAHQQVEQLSRVNELIRDVNSDLVRAEDVDAIVEAVCTELTRLETYGTAWFGRRTEEGLQRLGTAGETDDESLSDLIAPVLDRLDAVEDDTVTIRVEDDPEGYTPLRQAGYESAMAVRISHHEDVRASLVLYARPADAFDGTEHDVIAELGDTIGYALDAIRTREELQRREQELARKNDRLEGFASMVSHDLRNPLQVARGHTALLDDGDHVEAIDEALDRMSTIIENILTLARDESLDVTQTKVDLGHLAQDVWAEFETEEAALTVESMPSVAADRSYLRQILENLIRNALEHGGRDVTVRVSPTENGFVVSDDGPGIPKTQRETVFDRGVSSNRSGTGFGLAIVRSIARAHGWTVTAAESDAGGAAFVFEGVAFEDAT